MAQPAEDDAVDDEKDGELPEVDGEIAEVLDHGEACADEDSIDDAVGDVIKFIAQYNEEEQQAEAFDGLFGEAGVQALKGRTNNIAGTSPEKVGEHAVLFPLNEQGRRDGEIAPQRKAARRRNQGSRSKRSMKLTSRKMQTA